MSRLITAIALILGLAGPALADSISIGYSAIPVTRDYISEDATTWYDTQQSDGYTAGVLQVLYSFERRLSEKAALALTTGFGLPLSTMKMEDSDRVTGNLTGLSKDVTNEGDYVEVGLATIPVMVGVNLKFPSGENSITAGISAGAGIIAARAKVVDVTWAGPVGSEIVDKTDTIYGSVYVPTIMVLANLGYSIKVGEQSSIGLRLPVGFYTTSRQGNYTVTKENPPIAAGVLPESEDGFKIGGVTYGGHVVWSRDF